MIHRTPMDKNVESTPAYKWLRIFLKEFLLPVPEEVRLNDIFGSNDVQFLFPLQNLKDEIRFELGTKVSSCTRHVQLS